MPRYLEKRRRRWYAVLDVPKDVQDVIGKPRFVKSVGTESLTEAERLVHSVIAGWKAEIEAARRGYSPSLETQARLANEDYARADDDTREILDLVLADELEALHERSPNDADTYFQLRKGKSLNLGDKLEEWLVKLNNVSKTIDMKRSDVLRFIHIFPYSHLVKKREVRRWADALQEVENLKPTTVRRIVSACRGYWKFLQRKNYIDREDDPFVDAVEKRGSRTKASLDERRQHFAPEDIVNLLGATKAKGDQQLHDLITIAMWTGCRIEEVCSLKIADLKEDSIKITDAKSPAGNRVLPIHPKLAPTLRRLKEESGDGYVLSGLSFNKYDDRSNAIGKRFGRLKTEMQFSGSFVFHSIRKTVATLLENAGVPENVAADLLGHDKKTMTYGVYSGGARLDVLREALNRIDYPTAF